MVLNVLSPVVFLVDDESVIRDSLTVLLESTGLRVISFDSAEAFLNNYCPEQPGCLLLDVKMPLMDGLELQEELSAREINIPTIFISGNADIPDSAKAFRAGAVDFLEKPFDNGLLIERIHEAIKKDAETRKQMIEKNRVQARFNSLSPREKEVLQLIISSHSNKQAAKTLDISHRTIDAHRARVMKKMQADNFAELVTMVTSYAQ